MIRWLTFVTMVSVLCTSQIHAIEDIEVEDVNQMHAAPVIEVDPLALRIEQAEQEHRLKSQQADRGLQDKTQEKALAKKLRKEEKAVAKEANRLEKHKDVLRKEIHTLDVKLYNKILKLAKKLYDPVYNQQESRGGQLRLNLAILYLSELVTIHEKEEYGSNRKMERLFKLIDDIKSDLKTLKTKGKVPNHIGVEFEPNESAQVKPHVLTLLRDFSPEKKKGKTIGGNAGLAFFLGGGMGSSIGCTKNNLGARKLAVLGQLYIEGGLLFGPSINVGYYKPKLKGQSIIRGGFGNGGRMGLVLSGSCFPIDKDSIDFDNGGEVGLGIFGGYKFIGFLGGEICPLPTDWKAFRKELTLTKENGKFPSWLEGENIEEIQSSYSSYIEEYKKNIKEFLKKKDDDKQARVS